MQRLIKRLSEPSTYAGLAGLALVLGMSAAEYQQWANAVAGVFCFVTILLGESGNQ